MNYSEHYEISTSRDKAFESREDVYRVRLIFKQNAISFPMRQLEQRYDETIPFNVQEKDLAVRVHNEFLPHIKEYFVEYDKWNAEQQTRPLTEGDLVGTYRGNPIYRGDERIPSLMEDAEFLPQFSTGSLGVPIT